MEERRSQLNFSFPKDLKVRKSFEYRRFAISRKRLKGLYISIDYRFNDTLSNPRLGLTTPAKIGPAHLRVKFKRILREVFRLNRHNLMSNLEINVSPKSISKDLKYKDIEKDFLEIISFIKK